MKSDIQICEHCRDSEGYPKQSYKDKHHAVMTIFSMVRGELLKAYPCPYSKFWHISKKK